MKKIANSSDTFGSYIRRLRIKNDIGQRELAKKIGVAPSYLNDMEKNKRTAPRVDLMKKLSIILKANLDLLNDLAGNSKKTLAPDIVDFIENNPKIVSLLRAVKNSELSDDEIANIEKIKPQIISTGNIGCITQIANGTNIPILHTVELLDWYTGGPKPKILQKI